jgi:uncharacterized protein YqjF (DUF2071 family)
MYQTWLHLLFLHWRIDPEAIQKRLPPGLTTETFDGSAWIGIVPFFMRGVRPAKLPPVPGLSSFLELNLRTYVRDHSGRPGIWFFSLDANQPIAVWIARAFFALPYRYARMRATWRRGLVNCHSIRQQIHLRYRYGAEGEKREAAPGSLEFFLVERYRLFAARGERLLTARVYHLPYRLYDAQVEIYDAQLFALNGFAIPRTAPDHVMYSPRVDASVYRVERVK